jgi:hypothetical protein
MLIRVVDVSASGHGVSYRLAYSKPIKKYLLRNTFFVEYDHHVETGSIDQSVLVIPILSMIAPIAWGIGADIEIDSLDESYLKSLHIVREVLAKWYPRFSSSGTLNVRSVVRNRFGGNGTGLLFSGGLDAVTSYARHKDDKPDLISVWDCDPRLHEEEKWSCVIGAARLLAERDGVNYLQIRSNLTYFNERLLNYEFGFSSWYEEVAHGLLLLSMCAPITAARGIGRVLIASSNPQDRLEPWGSHPEIDNNVSWADVAVVHDALEMSRQQKMSYMCATNRQYLTDMKVCHYSPVNCTRCEKCARTIVGLCMEGVNPRDCGFRVDQKTLPTIRESVLAGKMPALRGQVIDWIDLRRHLPEETGPDVIGSREFFKWFKSYDFSQHRTNKWRYRLWLSRLRLLRLRRSMRSMRVTRQHLEFLGHLAVCQWHTTLYRGRRAITARLRFHRAVL